MQLAPASCPSPPLPSISTFQPSTHLFSSPSHSVRVDPHCRRWLCSQHNPQRHPSWRGKAVPSNGWRGKGERILPVHRDRGVCYTEYTEYDIFGMHRLLSWVLHVDLRTSQSTSWADSVAQKAAAPVTAAAAAAAAAV